jgi:SET and MYND domain-containing protein
MKEEFPWEEFMLARKVYIRLCLDSGVDFKNLHSVGDVSIPDGIQSLVETSKSCNQNAQDSQSVLAMVLASSFPLEPNGAVQFFEHLLHKFQCNNFGILDALQFVIGHGVYPQGAILNHSCDPNCILTYEGSQQVIRTIQPVKDGDELHHSYTDICEPTSIRQEHLQMIYGFQCECDRCRGIGKWKAIEDALAEDFGMTSEDQRYVQQCMYSAQEFSTNDDADNDDDMEELKRQYNFLCQALDVQRRKLGKYHLERYKSECLALSTSLMMGVEDTIIHAEHVVNFLKFVCNKYHPLLVVQQMTLADLQYVHGRIHLAEKQFGQLMEICKVTFGKNHVYVQRYQALLDEVQK